MHRKVGCVPGKRSFCWSSDRVGVRELSGGWHTQATDENAGKERLDSFSSFPRLISSTGMNNYAEHRPTHKKTSRLHWNATAGDVLQLSGEPDHQPLLISQPFKWWRLRRREPGLPDTWFITEGAPVLRCPGACSPAAVGMTFAPLSELKRAWLF